MDWTALWLSLQLGRMDRHHSCCRSESLSGGRSAIGTSPAKPFVEGLVALPLVLPPTVFGYYLLVGFGATSPIGQFWQGAFGHQLVFTFEGLLLASVIVNLPFAIQPMQRGFEAIPSEVRDAAACSGMTPWKSFLRSSCRSPGRDFHRHGVELCAHAGRIRRRSDGRRLNSRRNEDHRHRDLRSCSGLRRRCGGANVGRYCSWSSRLTAIAATIAFSRRIGRRLT